MDIRKQLQDRLTEYVKDTLRYINTARDFCDQEQKWTSERKAESKRMREIRNSKQNEKEKEKKLDAVLKDTLEGLEKLEPFLDAVEKLAVTSSHVFSGQIFLLWGESPERVQSVIEDARIDAPLLLCFKRDAKTFFQPLLHNVDILVFQLDVYRDKTEQLCRRIRQKWKMDKLPSVQLILNTSENAMHQMLHHLNQLCEIRMNQHTRLAFLFQENAQKFIDVFSERRSRMGQLLSDLKERAVKLNRMKKGASISTVAGSSVGILGGVLSITGIALAPFTAGASLACTAIGAGLGATNTVVSLGTEIAETSVNSHHQHNVEKSLKRFTEDMEMILECKDKAASFKEPSIRHCTNSNMNENVITIVKGAIDVTKDIVDIIEVYSAYKAFKNGVAAQKDTSTCIKAASVITNGLSIGLDIYFICKESASLANGSELSQFIRSRAALWKSEMTSWETICDSLQKGVRRITESQKILDQPFLPKMM